MAIRETLLLAVVIIICIAALVRPRIGLYGYVWFALMRPDVLAFADNKYPFSVSMAAAIILGSVRYLTKVPVLLTSPITRLILLLQIPVGLSVPLAVNPSETHDRYGFYVRMLAVLLLIPLLIETKEHLRNFLVLIVLSLGVVAFKFGGFGLIHGGVELSMGWGDMLGDNNFVALALATLVPLSWFLRFLVESRVLRAMLMATTAFSCVAVVMTNSRGGVLSLALATILIVSRTTRRFAAVAALTAFSGISILLVRDMFTQRMNTLAQPEEELSAASRISHVKTAFAMWKDYPLIGVGFGGLNYALLVPRYSNNIEDQGHVAHNSYMQMLVDSGIFAFILYVTLFVHSVRMLGRFSKRLGPERDGWSYAAIGLQSSICVFAFGSTFYSCQRMDLPYLLLITASCLHNLQQSGAFVDESTVTTENDESPYAIASPILHHF